MPCCKAEEYGGWCNGLDSYDVEGKQYCVFHAPKLGVGVTTAEEFNELVYARIIRAKHISEPCNLSGTVFKGDISFSRFDKDNPLPEVNFSYAEFSGVAYFSGAQFGGRANFRGARFSGEVYLFDNTQFSGGVDFSGALFSGKASFFIKTQFGGKANFSGAQFSGEADFSVARFSGEAHFLDAQFGGRANFRGARFSGEADFSKAKFSGEAGFTQAEFSGEAYFRDAKFSGEAGFFRVRFGREADFSKVVFCKPVDFSKATFKEKAVFYGIETEFPEFTGAFIGLDIDDKIRFENVNLKKISFLDTDLRKVDFINCKFPERKGQEVLYDEIELFNKKKEKSAEEFKAELKKVEALYRLLKQKYKEGHNEARASHWHYQEKEMQRHGVKGFLSETGKDIVKYLKGTEVKEFFSHIKRLFSSVRAKSKEFFLWLFLNLYYLTSGYGEEFERALVVLICLFLVFSVVLTFFLTPDSNPSYGIANGFIDTFKYATFQKDYALKPSNIRGEFIKILAQMLIPIQTALFIMALRNRFRR